MKSVFLILSLAGLLSVGPLAAQVNVGREYGNPTMPFALSHLREKNQRMLSRGNIPRHSVFGVILCFKWACRNQSRRDKSLHAISFNRFRKQIRKNAKKGMYKDLRRDSIPKKPVIKPPPETIAKGEVVPLVTTPDVDAPVLKTDSLIVLNEFLFETNSATLKGEQFSALDSIMDFLIEHRNVTVKISGHTDNRGKESHNRSLSTRRAEVIAEYLIGNGVSEDRVSFQGLGSSRPLASNDTESGRSKNRRVELLIHEKR